MHTINQKVLNNQNGITKLSADQDYLEWKKDMKDYVESVKDENVDLFSPAVLDEIAKHVFTEFKLGNVFNKANMGSFVETLLPEDSHLNQSTLEDLIGWIGFQKDEECLTEYYQGQKQDIVNLRIHDLEKTIELLKEQVEGLIHTQKVATNKTIGNKKKKSWLNTPIAQYTKDGQTWLKNWDSARQVGMVLGYSEHAIVEQLKRVTGSSYGFHWKVGNPNNKE